LEARLAIAWLECALRGLEILRDEAHFQEEQAFVGRAEVRLRTPQGAEVQRGLSEEIEKVSEARRTSPDAERRRDETEKETPQMDAVEDVDREEDESLGWFSIEDRARWPLMGATTGRLLVTPVQVEEKTEMIPFFITGHKVLTDGSLTLKVTSLGTKDPKVSRKVVEEEPGEEDEEEQPRKGALRKGPSPRSPTRGREKERRRVSFAEDAEVEAAEGEKAHRGGQKRRREEESGKGDGGSSRTSRPIESALDALKTKLRESMETSGGESEGASGLRESKKVEGYSVAQAEKKKADGPRSLTVAIGSGDESEDGSEESSDYSSGEESSEEKKARRLQAPLKRRSQRKKGSVINLLLEQIAEQLQDLSTPQDELLTSGPRVGTYWQVTLRQRHPAGHPALRELFLLATAIDKIRSGHLLESLDALAGRFIAVEAAIQDGWNVARHLEVAVPSDQSIAPTELQLAARRHSHLVAKAHGVEGKGAWRNSGGRGWQSGGGGKDGGKSWWRARDGAREGKEGKDRGGKWKKGGKRRRKSQEQRKGRGGRREGRCLRLVRKANSEETGSTKIGLGSCMIQESVGLKDELAAPMPGPSQTDGGDFSGSQTRPFSGPTGDPTSDLRMRDENEESAAREETAWMHEREALRTEETGGAAAEAQSTEVRGFEELLAAGGCRGEKVAELMCEKGQLRSLGLCFAWMILEGRSSALGEGWLWQKMSALGQRELGGSIKHDLNTRDIGYGGEEIGKVEQLAADQIKPSLPPIGKGGCIRIVDWVSPSTRRLLESPELLEVLDCGQEVPRLQGRVHIQPGQKGEVAKLLVERGVCVWRREEEVLRFRQSPVKNGLFGVVKPGRAVKGKETLRVIMNLIPSNSLHKVIQASVHRLPSISQWTSIFLGPNEHLEISQADITSAFYLFELPEVWQTRLAFNLDLKGKELGEGFDADGTYTLCARVLPMGWSSAVGIMEEAAEQLLRDVGLPDAHCINRVKLLPEGFVKKMREDEVGSTPFWHIYLDNFASGQRMQREVAQSAGGELHLEAERGWNERGVLTAPKKSVHRANVTASDASMQAGAVGVATAVSELGKDFLLYDSDEPRQGKVVPVLLISCFDGIGGAIRSYNIAGARPQMYVSIEIHRPARRVVTRRWPEALTFEDVTKVTDDVILEWLAKAGHIEEIHIWGGFPCKDLSGAKAGRQNLSGSHSSLFYQLKRIWLDVRRLCGNLSVHLFAENVCSMDGSARDQISSELGVFPYRVDSDRIVPLNRPRFVWTDLVIEEDDTIWTTWKEGFWQVHFECQPVEGDCWVDEGWEQETLMGYGTNHTYPAYSASAAKSSPSGYEDERMSLVGDAYPINTFWLFAAEAVRRWIPRRTPEHYKQRLGMFPGACLEVSLTAPIGTPRPFGSSALEVSEVLDAEDRLVRQLARRVSRNGSDIRVSVGLPTNPKLYPRQSVPAGFWLWKVTFQRRWEVKEHINALELRSILLTI
ncbi:unnamed protein product, partial [Durusdinium trenchii]